MYDIASERPKLAEKDWYFTINAYNEIEIIEGEDSFSKTEIEFLQEKLDGFSEEFSGVKEGLSAAYETSNGNGRQAPDHMRYDLNKEFIRGF